MTDDTNNTRSDDYDRLITGLKGLPDVIEVKPTTIRFTPAMLGSSMTFIVQTMRQKEIGDHIFLESVSRDGSMRIVLPPQVADVIARQRDALTGKNRSRAARRVAQERMLRGERPAFLNSTTKKKRSTKKSKKRGTQR